MVLSDLFKQPYDHTQWVKDELTLATRLEMEKIIPEQLAASLREFAEINVASTIHIEYVIDQVKKHCSENNIEVL